MFLIPFINWNQNRLQIVVLIWIFLIFFIKNWGLSFFCWCHQKMVAIMKFYEYLFSRISHFKIFREYLISWINLFEIFCEYLFSQIGVLILLQMLIFVNLKVLPNNTYESMIFNYFANINFRKFGLYKYLANINFREFMTFKYFKYEKIKTNCVV